MLEIEIRPFQPSDILSIDAREPDKSVLAGLGNNLEYAEFYARKGPAFTGWYGDKPIACAGIVTFWKGVGEGWALTSPLVAKFPCAFHRGIRKKLDELTTEFCLRRIQVAIPRSHHVSRRWIVKLGFRKESAMPLYGPEGTEAAYVRYVRLRYI